MSRTEEQLIAMRQALLARDTEQLAQIRNFGVDPAIHRQIDLTFWAPSEDAAKIFVEACKRNEMPPHTVMGPGAKEENKRWLIRCAITASVTFVTTPANVEIFILFGDKFACEYDGWGTAIVEAAAPVTIQ